MSRNLGRLTRLLLASLAMSFAACGDDTKTSTETIGDTSADGSGSGADTSADTGGSGADTSVDTEGSADLGPCPGTISCVDEVSGRARLAICTAAGYQPGTTCQASAVTTGEFCCIAPFACATNQDCEDNRVEQEVCPDTRYPCICLPETGKCVTGVCASAADCGADEICAEGRCQTAPVATGLVARIVTPDSLIAASESLQLWAVAVDPANPEITNPNAEIIWDTTVGTGSVNLDGLFTAAATGGSTTVRARVADNAADTGDTVNITTLAASASGEGIRVTLVDESSRAPLAGATVVVIKDGVSTTGTTDALGSYATGVAPPADIHVFPAGHAYVSLFGVQGSTAMVSTPPSTRAEIQEIRDGYVCPDTGIVDTNNCGGVGQSPCLCYQLDQVDVVKGVPSFERVANDGELGVSINGFALGNSLLDLNFDLIVGPSIDRVFPEGSPIPLADAASIPSGVTLYFNGRPLVDSFIATAPQGSRTLWSVGGLISLSRNPSLLPSIIQQVGGSATDIGSIIAVVLPLLQDFYSGVKTGIDMNSAGTFPVRDPGAALNVPTQRRMEVTLPSLAGISSANPDTVIILGGALVPGEGFVPLGITAGADKTRSVDVPDGSVDGDPSTPETPNDPLILTLAPIHGGILTPGTKYMIADVALLLGKVDGGPRELSSGQVHIFDADALPTRLDLAAQPFSGAVDNATWDAATRTLSFTAGRGASDITRAVFKNNRDQLWIAYGEGAGSYTMPAVPDTFDDRTTGTVTVVGVDLRDSDGVTLQSLIGARGAALTELFEHVSSFSILGL